jgi:hypothetical protein
VEKNIKTGKKILGYVWKCHQDEDEYGHSICYNSGLKISSLHYLTCSRNCAQDGQITRHTKPSTGHWIPIVGSPHTPENDLCVVSRWIKWGFVIYIAPWAFDWMDIWAKHVTSLQAVNQSISTQKHDAIKMCKINQSLPRIEHLSPVL